MGTNEDDSNNVCDCYLPDICQIWNNAFQVKGECNLTCQNNSRPLILKDSKGLHICSANNECTLQTYKGKDSIHNGIKLNIEYYLFLYKFVMYIHN